MTATNLTQKLWWERDDLHYRHGRLFFGNQSLESLAQSSGTPVYVYNATRINDNLNRIWHALESRGVDFKIFYALKANRYLPIVTYLKLSRRCGIDACSPRELLLARQVGFKEEEIIYTNTSVSNEDLDCLQRHPNVLVNCDAISTIKRLGQRCPGRSIGLRINPQLGVGYHQALKYAGEKATKFGIYKDRYLEALEVARSFELQIKTLHFHCGSGYLSPDLDTFDQILARTHWFLDQSPGIDTLDIGGGLGVPMVEDDQPLDIDRWAEIVAGHAKERGLKIHIEPGDYLMKDAGILIMQVNTVEQKADTLFVGVNGGFNIQNLSVYYNTPFEVVPLVMNYTVAKEKMTIAGNINEAVDLLAEDVLLPPVAEGDLLGFLNVGGYGSASSSNHCLRGQFSEYLLLDE